MTNTKTRYIKGSFRFLLAPRQDAVSNVWGEKAVDDSWFAL